MYYSWPKNDNFQYISVDNQIKLIYPHNKAAFFHKCCKFQYHGNESEL